MYCNRCGAQLQPDGNACPRCGATVIRPSGPGRPESFCSSGASRLTRHLRTLGILWMIAGIFWLLPAFALVSTGGLFPAGFHPGFLPEAFVPPFTYMLGSGFLLVAAAGVCIGWGLVEHRPWARVAALVVAFMVLLHPPFGTVLGVYTLWVLLAGNAGAEYEYLARNP
jgi:hypothetical protein